MNRIELINGSCVDQTVDAVVNAANDGLWAGGGICGVIFSRAGMKELTVACRKYDTPLKDGSAVITPAFNMKNAKAIIHAVGPNFGVTPKAFRELFDAYYNSLKVLMDNGYHSISFPLISSGIFGGALDNPAGESAKQCLRAYRKFIADNPNYGVDVKLCAFTASEMSKAREVFDEETANDKDIPRDCTVKAGKYRHFKGGEYEVIGIARHSETLEPLVVYRALYGDHDLWVRPLFMWKETVEYNGRTVPRFTYIGE